MENLLLKKLQLKSQFKVSVINAPANFDELIGTIPADIEFDHNGDQVADALLLFAITKAEMNAALAQKSKEIGAKTICWIFYPKAKSKLASDLNLMQSWGDLKTYGLTPCGSAAIDEIWTALRIKPIDQLKKSGLGNAEIQTGAYSEYIDVKNKIITLPKDLETALHQNQSAMLAYEKLSYSNQKEYVLWILTAKQEKTRIDRLQKTMEKLALGMKNPSQK
jgi:hypothetical protein